MKKGSNDGIRIIKQTKPNVCGGTDAYLEEYAPKEIKSDKMTFFQATSALGRPFPMPTGENAVEPLCYISAYALPCAQGSFLYFESASGYRGSRDAVGAWALVKEDIFPKLVELVRKYALAQSNGYHSQTHGLPENFGGSVEIEYESGEKIGFSNNQTPILRTEAAAEIAEIFTKAMNGEKIAMPDAASVQKISFEENRDNGGFMKAVLTIADDGTGRIERSSRYDGPTVYESVREVDAHTVAQIKENIVTSGIFAWSGLPESKYKFGRKKQMTFCFADGTLLAVDNERRLPARIGRGFFNIELELTTKS